MGDVEPLVIRDKGRWAIVEGLVELASDPQITWNDEAERKYIAVRRTAKPKEILLVGIRHDLRYFEQHAKEEPEIELLVVCKERARTISSRDAIGLERKLMHDYWRPEIFRESNIKKSWKTANETCR